MPSEKFFVHKEDGSLVRLKGRLVRFLDEEPPTGSDKSAIRTALEVSPDAEGLVQADVGTDPNQIVLHQHLGDISYQSAEAVSVGTLEADGKTTLTNDSDNALVVETTNKNPMYVNVVGSAPNYLFDIRDDDTSKFRVDGSGNVDVAAGSVTAYGQFNSSTSNAAGPSFAVSSGNGIYNAGSNILGFSTGGTERLRLDGDGLKFNGDTAVANAISDYEEGSATVSFVPDGGTVTIKSTHNTIYYRKVGKLVHIAGELVVDSVSSPTGEFKISGLPYASENVNNNRSAISIHTSLLSSSSRLAAFVEKNQSFAYVRLTGSTGYGQTSATVLQANTGIVIGGSYHTA